MKANTVYTKIKITTAQNKTSLTKQTVTMGQLIKAKCEHFVLQRCIQLFEMLIQVDNSLTF